jgi:hypothetical protein
MDLQEQLEVGKQAEEFITYISERPYFNGFLERMVSEYGKEILKLRPLQTEDFTLLKAQMTLMEKFIDAIHGDIYLGQEAFKKLNGIQSEPGGLL